MRQYLYNQKFIEVISTFILLIIFTCFCICSNIKYAPDFLDFSASAIRARISFKAMGTSYRLKMNKSRQTKAYLFTHLVESYPESHLSEENQYAECSKLE